MELDARDKTPVLPDSRGTGYTTRGLHKLVAQAVRKAWISKRVSPHWLRHSHATLAALDAKLGAAVDYARNLPGSPTRCRSAGRRWSKTSGGGSSASSEAAISSTGSGAKARGSHEVLGRLGRVRGVIGVRDSDRGVERLLAAARAVFDRRVDDRSAFPDALGDDQGEDVVAGADGAGCVARNRFLAACEVEQDGRPLVGRERAELAAGRLDCHQLSVELHSLVCAPASGTAVNVTLVPKLTVVVQVAPQLMPEGWLVTSRLRSLSGSRRGLRVRADRLEVRSLSQRGGRSRPA
jgi:hypothetical protein